jgi:hypothetical protein
MASPVEPPADPSWKLLSDLFTGRHERVTGSASASTQLTK